jgi:hypothetical protein
MGTPIAIIGNAYIPRLTLNPNNETIQPVTVVPTFAPRMSPTDSVAVKRPAFTRLTVITVVADDD